MVLVRADDLSHEASPQAGRGDCTSPREVIHTVALAQRRDMPTREPARQAMLYSTFERILYPASTSEDLS